MVMTEWLFSLEHLSCYPSALLLPSGPRPCNGIELSLWAAKTFADFSQPENIIQPEKIFASIYYHSHRSGHIIGAVEEATNYIYFRIKYVFIHKYIIKSCSYTLYI